MCSLKFQDFGLDESILRALDEMQFQAPSTIQEAAIPHVLKNKDLIARAKTGSGKTAACAIPICQLVSTLSPAIQALIIVPTRELALQYATETQKIGKYKGVKTFAICGGEDASMQKSKLLSGVQVLIATPGRLIDFIYSRDIDLSQVSTLILDEADIMLSMGFIEDLEFIIQCLIHPHQTLLFSATMPEAIRSIATKHMKEPVHIELNEVHPETIDHRFCFCKHYERSNKLLELIQHLKPVQSIIFCHSRNQTDEVCKFLQQHLSNVDLLHAGLSQPIRNIITSKFRSKKIQTLVATDVAARGLDFSSVSHVFIYELSDDSDTYLHRAGRTGRFEKQGMVISLVTARELKCVQELERRLKQKVIWIGEEPNLETIRQGKPRRKSYRNRSR